MEGPSLVILREEMKPFVGQTIVEAGGNAKKVDVASLAGQPLKWVKTWGKHLLLGIGGATIKVHFLLWGSYTIDRRKDRPPTMTMRFAGGEVNYYSSSVTPFGGRLDAVYDWRVDVMSRRWDAAHVRALVRAQPDAYVTDVLLDQDVFAGVGNIIKNEVLFTLRLHPEARVRDLTPKRLAALVDEAHRYAHQFYRWKKKFELKKHWRIYRKRTCQACGGRITAEHMGRGERYTYRCPKCQPKPKRRKAAA